MSAASPNLKLSVVQAHLTWSDGAANRGHLAGLLQGLDADVVLLPEMFTTGFNMSPQGVAEAFHPGCDTLVWMQEQAQALDALLLGSVAVEEGGQFFNRMLAVGPEGLLGQYDKRHLFSFAGEHAEYTAGTKRLIVEWRGWRICPLVCYDLRFPVWSRNVLGDQGPDYHLLVYVANWPAVRVHAWEALLAARAHENASYVAGCNRVGEDANGIAYNGRSAVWSMKGERLDAEVEGEAVISAVLSKSDLDGFRAKFPVLSDADRFRLEP